MKYTTYKNVDANVPVTFITVTFFQALEAALQGLFSAFKVLSRLTLENTGHILMMN